jgi:hypothetical protein
MIIAEKKLSKIKNKERFNVKSFRSVRRFTGVHKIHIIDFSRVRKTKKEDSYKGILFG